MTDYTMTKGMSDWIAKYNQFVNEQAVGVEKFGSEVFTLSNGASWWSKNVSSNRLIALELGNGYRIVQVEFALKIADYQAVKNKTVISIPLKYAPKIDWHVLEASSWGNNARWNMRANGTMVIECITDENNIRNANVWYPMSTIYITHD